MTQDSSHPATAPPPPAIPEPPRPVTPQVRRRAWAEPQVRAWLLLTAALVAGATALAGSAIHTWTQQSRLARTGQTIQAVGFLHRGARLKGMPLPLGQTVDIEYEYGGQKYQTTGMLFRTGESFATGQPFNIRIDPENPAIWTNRIEPPPLLESLLGSSMMLTAAIICFAAALLIRGRWVNLWINGDLRTARIISQSQTALAPRSVALRCALRAGKIERLTTIFVPHEQHLAADTPTIQVIASPDAARALAVMNYQSA